MPTVESLVMLFTTVVAAGAGVAIYVRMADQWFKDREDDLETLVEYKKSVFFDSISKACEVHASYVREADEEGTGVLPVYAYRNLSGLAKKIAEAGNEYLEWDGFKYRYRRKLRGSATYLIYALLPVNIINFTFLGIEFNGGPWLYYTFDFGLVTIIISLILMIVLLSIPVHRLLDALKQLNRIDELSENMDPVRRWEITS